MPDATMESVMKAYGWKTPQEMIGSREWAAAFKEAHSTKGALKLLDVQNKDGQYIEGWFLRNRDFVTEWTKDGKPGKKEFGPVVLQAGGYATDYRNGTPLDLPTMTPVRIGPVKVRHVISEGKTKVLTPKKEVKVEAFTHSVPLPDLTLQRHLDWCRRIQDKPDDGKRKSKKAWRGVLNGRTNDNFPVLARFTLGDFDSIQYYGPGGKFENENGEVRARAVDSQGQVVTLRADGEQVLGLLGLEVDARPDDVREQLENQEVIASGQVQVGIQKTPGSFVKTDEEHDMSWLPPEVQAWIDEAKGDGWLKPYKETTDDQGRPYKLYALHFKDGTPAEECALDLLGKGIIDAIEQKPGNWWFYVHHEELQSPPQFEARFRSWNEGDNGRFVVPLANVGLSTKPGKYDEAAAELDALIKASQSAPPA